VKQKKEPGLFAGLYRFHYGIGLQTMRLLRRCRRFVGRHTQRPRRALRYLWLRRVAHPAHRFMRGVAWLFPHHRPKGQSYFESTREEWKMLGRFFGPLVGAVALAVTLLSWTGVDYCLEVTYQGKSIGAVENAEVYAQGVALAKERVVAVADYQVAHPVFTMTMQGHKALLTPEQVCDEILRTSKDIVEATGLYVDGKFVAAMDSGEEMQAMLTAIKKEGVKQAALNSDAISTKDKDLKVGFAQKVKMTNGLYPASSLLSREELENRLTAVTTQGITYTVKEGDVLSTIAEKFSMTTKQLRKLNPPYANTDFINVGDKLKVQIEQHALQVKVVKTITDKNVTVNYKTQIVYRDDMYVDQTKTATKGKNGKQTEVREIVVIDGVEKSSKVIERTVTKKAVTEVVYRGTKKRPGYGGQIEYGDGVTHGNMLWPVPICHNMSRGYSSGHKALDIANGPVRVLGKPAVAADGGVVIQAATGWNGGYGNVVKIRHSNGLITVYAHLQTVKVVTGQSVSRGQTIGLIGNTGYSFGPHLHFEVIKNGVKVNPIYYVKP